MAHRIDIYFECNNCGNTSGELLINELNELVIKCDDIDCGDEEQVNV